MKRTTAGDVMSAPVRTVAPDSTIPHLVQTMRESCISGLPVVEDGKLIGIVTEGDVIRKASGSGGLSELSYTRANAAELDPHRQAGHRVRDIMTTPVLTATPPTPVREVARLMARSGVKRVPILDGDRLVGIVARADVISLFARPAGVLLADVTQAMRHDLDLSMVGIDIVVRDGVVSVSGLVSDVEPATVVTVLSGLDGVVDVDASRLAQGASGS